jgi:glucosamine--fructose-6-phosphate aminotransferase (isomerizing)
MIKEIVEQRYTIKEAVQYTEEELAPLVEAIRKAKHVYTVGAGTASFAAGQIAYFLRRFANIPAQDLKSYEMESYVGQFTSSDVVLAISQSGETADTIEAIEFAKAKGAKIASLVNMLGSTTTRISDYPYFSRSGPEICVASTKAFTAQISWGYLLAMSISGKYTEAKEQITDVANKLENYFSPALFAQIKELVKKLAKQEHFFVLGKGQNFFVALEGALKVKEITYKHFEGFAAGELKHGVIALIDKGTPVFAIVSEDANKADMLSAVAEVKARGAFTIAIGKKNNDLYDEFIETPEAGLADSIVNVIPFQLISYFLGVFLGRSPDKPRNLAKSVTVK